MTKRFQTVREFLRGTADYGLSEFFVRAEIKAGRVPGFKSGTRFYIDTPAFLQLLENRCAVSVKGGCEE